MEKLKIVFSTEFNKFFFRYFTEMKKNNIDEIVCASVFVFQISFIEKKKLSLLSV